MLKIEGLKKMYGRATALDGLSMHVREGASDTATSYTTELTTVNTPTIPTAM